MGAEYAVFEGKGFSMESNTRTKEEMAESFKTPEEKAVPAAVPQADGDGPEPVEEPEKPKSKVKPIQPRIDQLVREKREAEEKALRIEEKYQRELSEVRSRLPKEAPPAPPEPKPAETKGRPMLADFETIEDHAEAVANWVADNRAEKAKAEEKAQKELSKRKESEAVYEKKFETFRDAFVSKLAEDPALAESEAANWIPLRHLADASPGKVTVENFIAQQFIDREKGLDLLVYFKDNPAEVRRISALQRPIDVMVELGIIEKGLGTGLPTASVPAPVSKAAPPARPVTGGPPILNQGPSADDDDDTYYRKRMAEELRKRKAHSR